jgi:hypothetical protein
MLRSKAEEKLRNGVSTLTTGGIDFRDFRQATQLFNNAFFMDLKPFDINFKFDEEILQFKNLISSGMIPSTERIRELVGFSYQTKNLEEDTEKLLGCISDFMRLEEERSSPTDAVLKDFLALLISLKS